MIALGVCRPAHLLARAWVPRAIPSRLLCAAAGGFKRNAARDASTSPTANGACKTNNLVSVEESLEAFRSEDEDVVFVDGSFYHKGGRNGRTE